MNVVFKVILAVLVLLAVSSGITKIMLMPQEVNFFGSHGFTNPALMLFGCIQVLGGAMIIFAKTRFYGALLVYITFFVSAIILVLQRNILFGVITLIAMVMLGVVMRKSRVEAP